MIAERMLLAGPDVPAAYRALYLLPSAPRELVDDAYLALRNQRLARVSGPDATLTADLDALAFARAAILSGGPHAMAGVEEAGHSPWAILHVAKDAPPEIVELAYRHRRLEHDCDTFGTNGLRASQTPAIEATTLLTTSSPSSSPVRLVAEAGAALPARADIGESPLRIGGDPTCDIVVGVTGTRKGRTEARLWRRQGRVLFHGVAGLTSVNGHAAGWAVLESGDTVRVGDATFRLEP